MLYLAIPAHNEAATIGVLLWRLRTVLAEFPREYEAVVYDDASSDSTSEILESYAKVMPLTVLRGERQVGYAGAVDALIRHVARDTRYPRRDAMLLLQGDFTDSPSLVPEFIKRFEGGMDVVVGERGRAVRRKAPAPVKRLLQVEPWLTRFLVRAEGLRDLTSSYRLIRISVLRDLLRTVGDAPVCVGDARTANAELLMRIVPLARRVEALPVEPTWEIRLRETRVVAVPDAMALLRWAWRSRGRRAVPSTAPETSDAPRGARNARDGRADLRLEGRSDSSADATVVVESGRNSGSRDAAAGRGRKPRVSRNESKPESRVSSRSESRNEARPEPKNEARPEPRNEARSQPRSEPRPDSQTEPRAGGKPEGRRDALPIPRADAGTNVSDADSTLLSESTARERPPRRKRTRGGRRDRAGNAAEAGSDSPDLQSPGIVGGELAAYPIAARPVDISESDPPDLADRPFVGDVELSASLSDAVADVELEMDGGGRMRPPRKKRRRRGSRGGRTGTGAPDGEEAGDGSAEASEADDGIADRPSIAAHSGDDRASGDVSDGDSGSDTADDEAGGDAESRVRRRGRRGRRGGSRRSRAPRGDGENNSGGEDFSPPPPSAPAPAPED